MDADFLQRALLAGPAILFSLTFHEFSHAYLAYWFGDTTARDLGRLTFNPLAHLDLFGTIVMVFSQFTFGWAKPVPVNPWNLRNPRRADFWISAAGPLSNLTLALAFGSLFRILGPHAGSLPEAVPLFLMFAVQVNIALAVFNLIPLFPLDGSHMLRNVLPEEMGSALDSFDRIAPFVLLLLVVTGAVSVILVPIMRVLIPLLLGA
ncbi:MAG TPA: site-2 protease family protein [candidate division Zixibacteria bacterium]|nr:site-2 protease family protein [candidate division Zixibacteria bacterium]MDD4918568.1 site-2 protease family protein [candidate division Zixibacteria bacterium]MDM7971961.1 site-2 protease family protein [candidate division Zixibacteria bacterium]HOD65628.1 site-2 protease family protein [candidate division Zixibacteria bacterium]HPI31991.1 site-2 protease family protein [candidate division Zixibacteria bacterium]